MHYRWLASMVIALLGLTACIPNPLDDALDGTLPPQESNTMITEYCQTCHIHRAFDPSSHTSRMQALYDRPPYTVTTECRMCHVAPRDTWGTRHRKTVWPQEVARERHKAAAPRFHKAPSALIPAAPENTAQRKG